MDEYGSSTSGEQHSDSDTSTFGNTLHLDHVTFIDPELVHQVIFTHGMSGTQVSCNCRHTKAPAVKGISVTTPHMGVSKDLDGARKLYNDPENHYAPFDPKKDKAKW